MVLARYQKSVIHYKEDIRSRKLNKTLRKKTQRLRNMSPIFDIAQYSKNIRRRGQEMGLYLIIRGFVGNRGGN